jgi:hypothetical protein
VCEPARAATTRAGEDVDGEDTSLARQVLRAALDRALLALRVAEFAGTRLVPQADATVLELLDAQLALVASRAFVEMQRALGAPLDQQPAAR